MIVYLGGPLTGTHVLTDGVNVPPPGIGITWQGDDEGRMGRYLRSRILSWPPRGVWLYEWDGWL